MMVVSICDGTGLPLLSLLAAIHKLKQKNIHITIVSTFIFEKNADSAKMCRKLREIIQYPGIVTEYQEAETYRTFANTMHIPDNTVVFCMTGTPCTSISRGAKFATRCNNYGIHGSPSNVWWHVHAGHAALPQRIHHKLIVFGENVVPANHLDLQELDATAGYRNLMTTLAGEGASRARMS